MHKAKLTADDIRVQIETTVLRLVAQIDVAKRRIEVLAPTTDHADARSRGRAGALRRRPLDQLRRPAPPGRAGRRRKLRQARARTDYLKSVAALGAVTDEILDRYQVVLR